MKSFYNFWQQPLVPQLRIAFLSGFVLSTAFFFTFSQARADEFTLASGGKGGTYYLLTSQAIEACQNDNVTFLNQDTKGSVENVDLIVGNKVNGGLVQADVMFLNSQTRDLTRIKQLMAFHPEELHVLTLAESRQEGGVGIGSMKFNKKTVEFNSIKDLAGRRLGAVGGSAVTAEVIKLLTGISFDIIPLDSNNEMLKGLGDGSIDAALAVGGQPLPWIDNLNKTYKLIPIPGDVAIKLSKVYRPAVLNYSKLGARGVETVSTDAMLVAREYKGKATVAALSSLRSCLISKLDDIAEAKGNHPKWQEVRGDQDTKPENRGKWPWMELPSSASVKAVKK